jgi:hypothetical protein
MNELQNHRNENTASQKHITRNIILISVIFAAVILTASVTIDDADTARTVTLMLIALWFVPFLYFAKARNQSSN